MGRTLSNTMMNIGIQATVDEALYQVRRREREGSDPSIAARSGYRGAPGD